MKISMRWTTANKILISVLIVALIPFMAMGFEWLLRHFFMILEVIVNCV